MTNPDSYGGYNYSCGEFIPAHHHEKNTTTTAAEEPCDPCPKNPLPSGIVPINLALYYLQSIKAVIPLSKGQGVYLANNDAVVDQLWHVIDFSPAALTPEYKKFVINVVEYFKNNENNLGEVDFNYRVIVDKSLIDNPCLYGVYTQLGKAPTFQNYLQKFDGKFSIADLKLVVGNHTKNPEASAWTFEPVNKLIEIRFNPTKLSTPKLNIARTFIHEMIHAEIYRQLLSVAGTPNIPWSADFINSVKDDFPVLADYYTRYQYNVPAGQQPTSVQHELMADHYRDIIIQAMKEFDPTQSNETYTALSWIGLMGSGKIDEVTTGLPPKPTVAWNNIQQTERLKILKIWRDYIKNNIPCQKQ